MRSLYLMVALLVLVWRLPAQTNEPVRLALVTETDEAAPAADVLTAQLSANPGIHLLERDEIARVYREQGLSAANQDYLKLGGVLGADGLLVFDVVRTKTSTNLTARLIAVKPGVVLTEGSFAWPLKDTAEWAGTVPNYLASFLPKLSLLAKDAIPISVVNLRSATASPEAQETERELKLLAIQRLSQERQFFVLERQRLELLSGEKELKSDDSPFWNGSYLLEGVVDQNGYSPDGITIDARLTPSKGGAPLLFAVRGSRTNYSEVINHLAEKVAELLKVNSIVKEWNAADEAAQYLDEAKWALRWGVYSEAQAAADSAWALGKHDMDCATVRVKAYEIPVTTFFQKSIYYDYNPAGTNAVVQAAKGLAAPNPPWGLIWSENDSDETRVFDFVFAGRLPDAKDIDAAAHVLQLYYDFSRSLPTEEPEAGSPWYLLGVEALEYASAVLQQFHFVPESQAPVVEKLAGLRAQARSVAGWLSQSRSVRDSYFKGDRFATHDELYHTVGEEPTIFRCKVKWGCFWQEKPEDCVALYRGLMVSPVFRYIHNDFWIRELQTPRLTAWNEEDRLRIPAVWNNFVGELSASTNVFCQLEARALAVADADADAKLTASFTNLFNAMLENRATLVAENVDVLYMYWGTEDLINARVTNQMVSTNMEALQRLFFYNYGPKLDAMNREYWGMTIPAARPGSSPERTPAAASAPAPAVLETMTNVLVANQFYAIPLEGLQGDVTDPNSIAVTAHHWMEGKILLDLDYFPQMYAFDKRGNWIATSTPHFSAVAVFDPVQRHWDVLNLPEPNPDTYELFYSRTVLFQDELYSTVAGRLFKYNFQDSQWQALSNFDAGSCELFSVSGHLYAANHTMIAEIIDGGKGTRLLASNRRQPPASALDTQPLGTPTLFEGPEHSLSVRTANKVFNWTGSDWREDSAASPVSPSPGSPQAASSQSNLYRLGDPSETKAVIKNQRALTGSKILPEDGFYAELLCYTPGLPLPQKALLRFEAQDAAPLVNGVPAGSPARPLGWSPTWIIVTSNLAFFGSEGYPGSGYRPGVWMMPLAGIESALAPQRFVQQQQIERDIAEKKQLQLQQIAAAAAAAEKHRKDAEQLQELLIARYDRNHNGIIDPGEKEEALADAVYVRSQLDLIDTNHNGLLDVDELAYFDANANKILDPNELAGINIAEHLLAARLLKEFDTNGDGALDTGEFAALYQSKFAINQLPASGLSRDVFPDDNLDGVVDLAELEAFLKRQLLVELRRRRSAGPPFLNSPDAGPTRSLDSQQRLKAAIEFYWQHPGPVVRGSADAKTP